jgi:hypothetical protein
MMKPENNTYQTPCIIPQDWDLTPPELERVNKYLLSKDTISIIGAIHDNVNTTWAVDFPDDSDNFFDPTNVPFLASQQIGCPLVQNVVNVNIDPVEEPEVEVNMMADTSGETHVKIQSLR